MTTAAQATASSHHATPPHPPVQAARAARAATAAQSAAQATPSRRGRRVLTGVSGPRPANDVPGWTGLVLVRVRGRRQVAPRLFMSRRPKRCGGLRRPVRYVALDGRPVCVLDGPQPVATRVPQAAIAWRLRLPSEPSGKL